jgi:hypothetical protein
LVSSFVQQIGKKVHESGLRELVRKAIHQLSRIELTYDRVLAAYDKLPPKHDAEINVRDLLHHIMSELPALNRKTVKLYCDHAEAVVSGDAYRLLFALTSMLAYLVRSRANTGSIKVKVQQVNSMLEISMSGPVQHVTSRGQLESLVEKTRAQIALGDDVLERIAQEFGGIFERHPLQNGREYLSLQIPAAAQPSPNVFN